MSGDEQTMRLNSIKAAPGSRRRKFRVGRGIASGVGKTAGLGHKGQRARSGGFHRIGFEGGQTPMQRRLPKFGFTSRKSLLRHEEVALGDLSMFKAGSVVTPEALREKGLIKSVDSIVKVLVSAIDPEHPLHSLTLQGIAVSKGARAAIEKAGGTAAAVEVISESVVSLKDFEKLSSMVITLESLKKEGLVPETASHVRVKSHGGIKKAVTIKGLGLLLSVGARRSILAAGGKVEA